MACCVVTLQTFTLAKEKGWRRGWGASGRQEVEAVGSGVKKTPTNPANKEGGKKREAVRKSLISRRLRDRVN